MSNMRSIRSFWHNALHSKKRMWFFIACAVAVLIIGGLTLGMLLRPEKKSTDNNRTNGPITETCSEDINKQADTAITNTDQVALAAVVDIVKQQEGYDRDPNCLYIVLQYQLATGDAKSSRTTLDRLKAYAGNTFRFSRAFTTGISIQSLEQNVHFLSESDKNEQQLLEGEDQTLKNGSNEADKFQKEQQ